MLRWLLRTPLYLARQSKRKRSEVLQEAEDME